MITAGTLWPLLRQQTWQKIRDDTWGKQRKQGGKNAGA